MRGTPAIEKYVYYFFTTSSRGAVKPLSWASLCLLLTETYRQFTQYRYLNPNGRTSIIANRTRAFWFLDQVDHKRAAGDGSAVVKASRGLVYWDAVTPPGDVLRSPLQLSATIENKEGF